MVNEAPQLPEGTVTLLFTDIEGSTRLLQGLGDGYSAVLEEHRLLLRAAFRKHGGHEVGTEGDSFVVVFPHAGEAVRAAVAAQRALAAHPWPQGGMVRVRMALHTGEPTLTAGEYVGLDLHRAARIRDAGHGGQILLSQTTRDLVAEALPEGVSVRDLGAHRLKDLPRRERLFQVAIADLPSDFPPLQSLALHPNNLPLSLTRFIGREGELAEVTRLLGSSRLVTLTGAGGCGKTRLAVEVARERMADYEDGVWLVELAALTDPALVPQAVRRVLEVREEAGRPLTESLVDLLREKRMLLVLDNCEHLVGACAVLAERLIGSCPQLTLLATSREPLGIAGEATYRVPSLGLPDLWDLPRSGAELVSGAAQSPAIQLFVDRALLCQPAFALTNDNVAAVAQVCGRLDGLPLAIELAAARVKVLTVEQIAARLDDRFRLLTGGSRTALPRHQTLRAAIAWSYDLLSEPEQALLQRLAVFAGSFTLEAAEGICADGGAPLVGTPSASEGHPQGVPLHRDDVLDLLTRLVDKSLVVVEEESGEARYRLLETIRRYGEEKLQESGTAPILRQRHRDWFLGLAEQAEPRLWGPAQHEWLERLEREHDNLRAALQWSLEVAVSCRGRAEAEAALRLAAVPWKFWELRGYVSEGRRWLEQALAVGESAPAAVCANALNAAGNLARDQGDYARAAALHGEALTLRRQLGDKRGMAASLNNLANVALDQGDNDRAATLYEEALTLRRELGDEHGIALALNNLGIVTRRQGDYARTAVLCRESLARFRELGDQWGCALSLSILGEAAREEGDCARAVALHEESLVLRRQLGDKHGIAVSLNNLGLVSSAQGDPTRAVAWHEEALAYFQELGEKPGIARSLTHLGRIARDQGDCGRAAAQFQQSLAIYREVGDQAGIVECLESLAAIASAQGQSERAARLFGVAEALREGAPPAGWSGVPIPPTDRAECERHVSAARGALGGEAFAAAWAEGRGMTVEQALAYALEEAAARS